MYMQLCYIQLPKVKEFKMIIETGILMYPLQAVRFTDFNMPTVSSRDALIFVIFLGAVILALVILTALKNKAHVGLLSENHRPEFQNRRGFSVFVLHRIANSQGLDRQQTKMLEFVLRSDGVVDPERSINSPNLIDRHFKRAFRIIERTSISEDEMNDRLAVLFSTRNLIENNMGTNTATSTRQIPENAAAVLAIDDKSYPVRVISSRGDSLVVDNPMSSTGEPLKLPRGRKVNLSFFTKSSKGFSVESRVLGFLDTPGGGSVMQLVHSGQIKKLSNRRFRRRQTVISTSFHLVHVEQSGRKKERKMIVEKRKFSGNIMDLSIGGCSIKTVAPVSSGQRLKIEFTREDNSIVVALGEVLRTNRTGSSTIMHVKFLKVPRKSLNSINAMVYEYAD